MMILKCATSKQILKCKPYRLVQTVRAYSLSSAYSSNKAALSYHSSPSGDFFLSGQTIHDRLTSIARLKPNEVAYKFCATQTSFTFLELKQRVDELAQSYMVRLGLQKADRVALMLPNVPEMLLSILALAQIGCISVLMNPAYNIDEVEYMLKKTKARAVLALDNFKVLKHYDMLSRLCPELTTSNGGELNSKHLSDLKHVIMVENKLTTDRYDYSGTLSFQKDLAKFNGSSKPTPNINFDDTVALLFTSGTTGVPKAAPLSHFALVNSSILADNNGGCLESNRISCISIPIFHVFGLCIGSLSAISSGTRVVYPHLFPNPVATMQAIESEKCTALKGPPVIFCDIINHPDLHKYDLSSLELAMTGSSVVPKELLLKVKSELKLKHALVGYSMTESGCAGTHTKISDVDKSDEHAYETMGTAMPFTEIKIVDLSTGDIVEKGVDGEICIRAYGVMKAYWEDPVETAKIIDENRWLHTGDIGHMTSDGYIVYKSRVKEMIKRGGINIYPAEIEGLIRTHPRVHDCYVFGVADERLGEEMAAWVALKPGCEVMLSEREIKEFVVRHVAAFKVPKYVRFVSSFPLSATGKVQKFRMAQLMTDSLMSSKQ